MNGSKFNSQIAKSWRWVRGGGSGWEWKKEIEIYRERGGGEREEGTHLNNLIGIRKEIAVELN